MIFKKGSTAQLTADIFATYLFAYFQSCFAKMLGNIKSIASAFGFA